MSSLEFVEVFFGKTPPGSCQVPVQRAVPLSGIRHYIVVKLDYGTKERRIFLRRNYPVTLPDIKLLRCTSAGQYKQRGGERAFPAADAFFFSAPIGNSELRLGYPYQVRGDPFSPYSISGGREVARLIILALLKNSS